MQSKDFPSQINKLLSPSVKVTINNNFLISNHQSSQYKYSVLNMMTYGQIRHHLPLPNLHPVSSSDDSSLDVFNI